MQEIKWLEEYSVGNPELDAQHRKMIELLAGLVKFTNSGGVVDPSSAIAEVNRYAEQHLRHEEMMLSVRGYPEYARHKAEHDVGTPSRRQRCAHPHHITSPITTSPSLGGRS